VHPLALLWSFGFDRGLYFKSKFHVHRTCFYFLFPIKIRCILFIHLFCELRFSALSYPSIDM
jgi:hypothetical protein